MNDAKALWKAIALAPGEDTPKLALADLYQELGDAQMEYAIRWCVARRVWPMNKAPRRFLWIRRATKPGRNHLPAPVFEAMPMQDGLPGWCSQFHAWCSLEPALRALARGLEKLRRLCEVLPS